MFSNLGKSKEVDEEDNAEGFEVFRCEFDGLGQGVHSSIKFEKFDEFQGRNENY